MILIPTIMLIAVLLIVGGTEMSKNSKYNLAIDYLQAQDFDNARTSLTKLEHYKDVDILLQQITADELYSNEQYADAYDIYSLLPDDYQTHEEEYAAAYEYATEMAANQNYEVAYVAFSELGNYKDSVEQSARAEIAYKEKLASDYISVGDFDSARSVYISLGNNDMATECLYLLAASQETTAPWLSYATYVELGEYKDSSIRAEALYGQRYERIGSEDLNGLRCYFDPETQNYGLLNANADVLVEPLYSEINLNTNGNYTVCISGKYGVLAADGQSLIGTQYNSIDEMEDGRYLVCKDYLYGVVSQAGEIVVAPAYDEITLENTGTYTVELNSKYGIIAYDGTVVHEPSMQEIRAGSNDGKYLMFKQDGLYGFLDASTFEVVVAAEWKNATIMYDGYAYIYNNLDKWGVISAAGNVIVSPQWEYITYFDDCGCALRSKTGGSSYDQCYLMNARGTLIMDFSEYNDEVTYLGNSCFTDYYGEALYDVTMSTAYAYTVNNRDVRSLRMLDNGLLTGEYYSSNYNYCYGIIDPSVPQILSTIEWEEPISVLPCRNRCGEKYGWIDEKGGDMIKPTYDYIRPFVVNGYIVAANYNDRGNLVYMLLNSATGTVVAKDIKTEEEAINYYDENATEEISLHERIIVSFIKIGFNYESSEQFLAALLSEDDSMAKKLYNSNDNTDYGSELYNFWRDVKYDIDDGTLNTEEKVWERIQKIL